MISFLRYKWISWVRNARTLVGDVSFNRNLRILGVIVLLSMICFMALWYLGVGIKAELYNPDGSRHILTFHEYLFSILGAIDADPDAAPVYAMYSAFVRLVGAILIGGVLTSFLCSLLSRFSDMTLRGLLVPTLSNHVVIVGYTALTDDLIRMLLSESEKNSFDNWYPYRSRRKKKGKKILLYTSGDVQSIRDALNSVLDSDMERHIVYAFGDMDMTDKKMADEVCQKLSLLRAQSVIILGDACDPGRGDLKNLAFASVAGGYVRRHRLGVHKKKVARMGKPELERLRYASENMPIPFYVQMDDISSFGLIKHMEYKIGSKALSGEVPAQASAWESIQRIDLGTVGVYIRPFSYYEGWARAIWGAPYPLLVPKRPEEPRTIMSRLMSRFFKPQKPQKLEREKPEIKGTEESQTVYFPLDFRPMGKESQVHLVVAGLSSVGEVLVVEAIRICHYPNGKNTIITVIDMKPDAEVEFRVHHPEVFSLEDISIEFRCERLQSESARSFIAGLAQDCNCILTLAICFRNIESTMFEGLCLPREVYYAYEAPLRPDGGKSPNHVAKRESYSKYPPRVLVYQEHVNGNPEDGESSLPVRYRFVRPFGMQEQGLQTRCMRSFASMYLNAAFFWPLDADGKSFLDLMFSVNVSRKDKLDDETEKMIVRFREKWKDVLSGGRQSEIPADERYKLLKRILSANDAMLAHFKKYAFRRFIMMEPIKEWGNVYVPDSYGTILRSIGLEAELPTADRPFNESSAEDFRVLCAANEQQFAEALQKTSLERTLEEVEHRRWMADRALMGYRPNRPDVGEVRDDGYRYHNAICRYSELSEADKNKDALVIRFIPLFMALEGLKIKPRQRPGRTS